MLLFIGWSTWEASAWKNFNTSHVTVYRSRELNTPLFLLISIHLMLLFIAFFRLDQVTCLNFNTSHVTVYLFLHPPTMSSQLISIHLMLLFIVADDAPQFPVAEFQYISCYCLSFRDIRPGRRDKFQYISCYCLSLSCVIIFLNVFHFNTSHVTVYQKSLIC